MLLKDLQRLGVHLVIRKAAQTIQERGLARQMHEDPETGEVDVEGALMLACGAPRLSVLVGRVDEVVPSARIATYEAAIAYLDSVTPGRILTEWTDLAETTQEQVLEVLASSASLVAAAAGQP